MINLKNEQLVSLVQFLKAVALPPSASRVRTKIVKRLQVKIDELYKDEIELLEKYGKKDENGNLIEHDGSFSLLEETAEEYHKEKSILLNEETSINVDELKEKIPILLEAFETSEVLLSGTEAENFNLIMEQLENEMEDK